MKTFDRAMIALLAASATAVTAKAQQAVGDISALGGYDGLTRAALEAGDRFHGRVHDRITNTGVNKGVWADVGYSRLTRDRDTGSNFGYSLNNVSLSAGWDGGEAGNFIYGIAAHITNGDLEGEASAANSLGQIGAENVSTYGAALYVGTNSRDGFNLSVSAGYDRFDFASQRVGLGGNIFVAEGSSGQFFLETRFTQTIEMETLIWRPMIGFDVAAYDDNTIRETSSASGGFAVTRQGDENLGLISGGDVMLRHETKNHLFIPYIGAFYRFNALGADRTLNALEIATGVTAPLIVNDDRHSAEFRAGVSGDLFNESAFFNVGVEGVWSERNWVTRANIRFIWPF